jgi:hypothetical protein
MKKVYLVIITGLILISGITGCASGNAGANTMSAGADNFNFIFKYGFSGRNTLDTFKVIYTKDMGLDAPITIPLSLTQEEKDKIYQKMVEIDFFHYPDRFSVHVPDGEIENRVMPYSSYFFKVTNHGQTKELLWHEKVTNSEAKADKLRELIKLIRDIIESREEYKKLPEPKAGYL